MLIFLYEDRSATSSLHLVVLSFLGASIYFSLVSLFSWHDSVLFQPSTFFIVLPPLFIASFLRPPGLGLFFFPSIFFLLVIHIIFYWTSLSPKHCSLCDRCQGPPGLSPDFSSMGGRSFFLYPLSQFSLLCRAKVLSPSDLQFPSISLHRCPVFPSPLPVECS
jgi:hypothetical protein